ncbi:DUF3617 domain-containing protein [Cellvibrio polysaccharolyticus]|uniref:DUF3617 family protein n=1 Tax=Cellvibrio polysaccharolyticus TaxID=2082724 RepID=A0A928V8P1_9GAMM|nr:DUF3617 family protein [Cellvibrio polysaccharolyticus]MBE8718084.1 DUF3617 family protein [Cellvibrio polysaccharolyticus]
MTVKNMMLCGVIALGFASSAVMAEKIKVDMAPGLWENTFTIKAEGQIGAALSEAQKYMASLPESERKMLESMMQQQGVGLGNNLSVVQVCVTQQQIDSGTLPQADSGCEQDLQQLGSNKFRVAFDCPQGKGSGEIHFQNPKSYTGDASITTTLAGGSPEVVNVKQSGKWLSADCGTLKPPAP